MKPILLPIAGVAALAVGVSAASAASPAYCALYAKEFTVHAAIESQGSIPPDYLRDRAYHKCLNMDDEPLLPAAYADPATDGAGASFVLDEGSVERGEAESLVETPAPAIEAKEPAPPPAVAPEPATKTARLDPDPEPGSVRKRVVVSKPTLKDRLAGIVPNWLKSGEEPTTKSSATGGRFEKWSPEWRAHCRKYFPKSFDPKTGTVIPYKTGIRTDC
jgi:hypothetical protein